MISHLFAGFSEELKKTAATMPTTATVEHAAPVVKTLSSKIIDVIRKRPGVAAATAAAAGAGAGVGVAQAKAKKQEEEKRREAIRQLLMARLSEGGYLAQ